jgi:hypothetical protein
LEFDGKHFFPAYPPRFDPSLQSEANPNTRNVRLERPWLEGDLETDSIRPRSTVRKRSLIATSTCAVTGGKERLT